MKKAIVTGGAGFIGSHVVDALLARGFKVTVIDDLSTSTMEFVNPKADFIKMNINSPRIGAVIKKIKPNYIFHLAAQIDVRVSMKDPFHDANVNAMGTLRLLEAAREIGIEKFIYSSSGGAIMSRAKVIPTPEKHWTRPLSPYGVSKLSAENYIDCYGKLYGFKTVLLRYSNVYGPRQGQKGEAGVVAVFINQILNGVQPTIFGDGKQTRDFVYVGDVVNANMMALKSGVEGVFNISTKKETDVNFLLKIISEATHFNLLPKRVKAIKEERRSSLDNSLAKKELGWKPKVSLNEGVKKTVQAFQVRKAVKHLKNGGLVIYPTETAYALGADACNTRAVRKIFKYKKRLLTKTLPLIAGDLASAIKVANFSKKAKEIAEKYWPAPLTLQLFVKANSKLSKEVVFQKTVAIRVSSNEIARGIALGLENPIVSTSANISGKEACYSVADIKKQFKNKIPKDIFMIDAGVLSKKKPSTIVSVGKKIKVLRQGEVRL